jgi:hypothetical protein
MVHEYAAHRFRGRREEMPPVLERAAGPEPEVGLVDEGCRLERVPGSFAPEVRAGDAAELHVYGLVQALIGLTVAGAGGLQQKREVPLIQ